MKKKQISQGEQNRLFSRPVHLINMKPAAVYSAAGMLPLTNSNS